MHKSIRFAAILFGNCPHKVANMGAYNNLIAEFKERACCPIAVDARNKAGNLKIRLKTLLDVRQNKYV